MRVNRFLLSVTMLLASALLSACVADQRMTTGATHDVYRERVASVLISKDGKKLVVVGKDHHYIFDAPPAIVRTVTSDFQKFVTASFGEFAVDGEQTIQGRYALQIRGDAPEEAKMRAWHSGFYKDPQGRVRTDGALIGKRYRAGNASIEANARPLNREYFVDVRGPKSGTDGAADTTPLTPIVAAGALLLLYGVILYALPGALLVAGGL